MFSQHFHWDDSKKMGTFICSNATGQKQTTISNKRGTNFNLKSFKLICI